MPHAPGYDDEQPLTLQALEALGIILVITGIIYGVTGGDPIA